MIRKEKSLGLSNLVVHRECPKAEVVKDTTHFYKDPVQ